MVADALKNDQTLKFAVFTSFSFVLSSGMWYIFFSGLLSGSGFTVYWLTSLGIVSSLSCMMLLSPFIFAVAAICALTGFGKKGRLFFVSAMMTMLVPPFDHIQQNFRHFGDSVICNIDLFTKLIEYRIKFQVEPIMTLAPQFSKLRYESGEIDRRVQDLLAPVSNNLGINIRKKIFDEAKKREYNFHYTTIPPKPTESQPLTKPTKKPWYRLAKERESRRKEREKQGKSNEPGVQSNKEKFRGLSDEAQKFNDMADNVCGNMTKDAETRCEDKCAEAIASCKAIVNKDWKRKFANLFIDFIGFCEKAIGSRCVPSCVKPRQKMDYFCKMRGEDDGEASKANMEELLDRYSKAAKEGATSFLLDYEILLNTPKANLNVPTFNGFAIQLKQNFSGLHRLCNY